MGMSPLPAPNSRGTSHIPSPFQADIPERSSFVIRGLNRGRIRRAKGAVKLGQRDGARLFTNTARRKPGPREGRQGVTADAETEQAH